MILVTGANGLVGRAVVKQLLDSGISVRCLVRSLQTAAMPELKALLDGHCSAQVFELDFVTAGADDYKQALTNCTAVIHCAGLVHSPDAPAAAYDILNVQATSYLQQAAQKQAVRVFVFLSSSAVYGSGTFADVDETAVINPETAYAKSKAASEISLRANPPAPLTIVLRPSLVFGEGDRGNMIALIRQIKKGLYFHVGGNPARKSVIYAPDLALAIIDALERLPDGFHLLNVANDQPVSVIELADSIAKVLGRSTPPVVPDALLRFGATILQSVLGPRAPLTVGKLDKLQSTTTLSVNRLLEQTGFRPAYALSDALAREISWAQSNGVF